MQIALNNILEQHKKIYNGAIKVAALNLGNNSAKLGANYNQAMDIGKEFKKVVSKELTPFELSMQKHLLSM